MKKLNSSLLCLVMALVLAFSLTACNIAEKEFDINSFYATAVEYGFEGSLDDLIEAFKGDSAYAIAVSHGYEGSEADWLAALAGAKGGNGTSPHIGENGNWWVGEYDTGVKAQGDKGDKGDKGEPGKDGNDGAPGNDGNDGKDGAAWSTGITAPVDADGKDGDMYLDILSGDVYVKAAGTWQVIGNLEGPQGGQGEPGGDGKDGLSAYDIYMKYHPEYEGDEEQWMDDLVNGRLSDKKEPQEIEYRLDLNYAGAPAATVANCHIGDTVLEPARPTRPDEVIYGMNNREDRYPYYFTGWSTEPDGEPGFDGFGQPFAGDLTLYAQWRHTYVFEAEYTYLDDLEGHSVSGVAIGAHMIIWETDYANPEEFPPIDYSNGYAVSYLYVEGIALTFDIESDRDAEVKLAVRVTCEFETQTFMDNMYTIEVNGEVSGYLQTTLNYYGIVGPCVDIEFTVRLNKGDNRIRLITTKPEMLPGMGFAKAPIVDCIKIKTDAKLNMFTIDVLNPIEPNKRTDRPRYENLEWLLGPDWWLQ